MAFGCGHQVIYLFVFQVLRQLHGTVREERDLSIFFFFFSSDMLRVWTRTKAMPNLSKSNTDQNKALLSSPSNSLILTPAPNSLQGSSVVLTLYK